MRLLLILSAVLLAAIARAQNVGIGKSTPTEKLDVAGNVNIDGRLKLNGSAGQPGQTLMVQPDGTQQWINVSGYKRRIKLAYGASWTVPANVTEIYVELLGGGGGGAKGGGGGGGGYVVAKVKVAPGNLVTAITPSSELSGTPSATEGGFGMQGPYSSVIGPGFNIGAEGGFGATTNSPGVGRDGYVFGDSVSSYMIYWGGHGSPMVETYGQRTSTEYVTMRKQGDGGFCAYAPDQYAKGGYFSFNTQTLSNLTLVYTRHEAYCYGCGGAGGNTNTVPAYWGGFGGQGAVYISY